MDTLPRASGEQESVVQTVQTGRNVIVNAVAGSGKTTCMLHIGKALPQKRILILTYNARLKDETREKIQKLNLVNVECHSYHAFCVKYYAAYGFNDTGIVRILKGDVPRRPFWFDIILLDEVQDMTGLYCQLVHKIIKDSRYIEYADLWSPMDPDPIELPNEESQVNAALIQQFAEADLDNIEISFDDCPLDQDQETQETQDQIQETQNQDDEFDFTMPVPAHLTGIEYRIGWSETDTSAPGSVGMCVFGDIRQNIYAFKTADGRFLSMADRIWSSIAKLGQDWTRRPLKTSFRITHQMAEFVNRSCLRIPDPQNDFICACKSGSKVKYMICNAFGNSPANELRRFLAAGYKPSDIFVLCASVRSKKNPVKTVENIMVNIGVPCFVPVADDEVLRPDIIDGKIVFSTFHQSKGLERKIVMVFGFDESYFKFFNRDADPSVCPNELYVAMTRAREHLCVVHHKTNNYLPFLDTTRLSEICDVVTESGFRPVPIITPERSVFGVVELTRHLALEISQQLMDSLCWTKLSVTDKNALVRSGYEYHLLERIPIVSVVQTGNTKESVSDINGICLPAVYEYQTSNGNVSIAQFVEDNTKRLAWKDREISSMLCEKFRTRTAPTIEDFLRLSAIYNSLRSGYIFKLGQIQKFDWLKQTDVDDAVRIVRKYIPPGASYEVALSYSVSVNDAPRIISGQLDAVVHGKAKLTDVTPNDVVTIWEFKCVKELTSDHILQTALYAWLFQKTFPGVTAKYYLLNILDDTVIEIMVSPYDIEPLNQIVEKLLHEKLKSTKRATDDEFIMNVKSMF